MSDAAPSYRSLLRPALLTAGVSLVLFGIAHTAFISWIPSPMPDSPPPGAPIRFVVMFFAPVGFGLVPSAIAALLAAWTWRLAWGTPLASWRYGLSAASAILPAVVSNGLGGAEEPSGATIAAVLASSVLLPAAIGMALARSPRGALAGVASFPFALVLSMFFGSVPLEGWVLPFLASVLLVLGASGALMARFVARSGQRVAQ